MKKIILAFAFMSVFSNVVAQENNDTIKKNELKLNVFYTLGALPEVTYEYLLNDESAIGMSILFSVDDDIELNWGLTPYYRFYFGKKYAAGFFLEGFGMLNSSEELIYSYGGPSMYENQLDFALGLALGGKFITKKGFVGELYLGAGRNLFNDNAIEAVPRFGISLGKRF